MPKIQFTQRYMNTVISRKKTRKYLFTMINFKNAPQMTHPELTADFSLTLQYTNASSIPSGQHLKSSHEIRFLSIVKTV